MSKSYKCWDVQYCWLHRAVCPEAEFMNVQFRGGSGHNLERSQISSKNSASVLSLYYMHCTVHYSWLADPCNSRLLSSVDFPFICFLVWIFSPLPCEICWIKVSLLGPNSQEVPCQPHYPVLSLLICTLSRSAFFRGRGRALVPRSFCSRAALLEGGR